MLRIAIVRQGEIAKIHATELPGLDVALDVSLCAEGLALSISCHPGAIGNVTSWDGRFILLAINHTTELIHERGGTRWR